MRADFPTLNYLSLTLKAKLCHASIVTDVNHSLPLRIAGDRDGRRAAGVELRLSAHHGYDRRDPGGKKLQNEASNSGESLSDHNIW
jgi:hypothetical protein